MKYAAVIVETREYPGLGQIIFDHMSRLPDEFQLYIFYGSDNKNFIKQEIKNFDALIRERFGRTFISEHDFHMVNIESMDFHVNDQASYNKLLTSMWFWDQINADQVLIFQPDSHILTTDRKEIYRFIDYDYVGAPWQFQQHGGNGGISWRTVWTMKHIIAHYPYNPVLGNEDVYFCNIMNEKKDFYTALAPREVCESFGVESIFKLGTFCCHAIDKYLSPAECNAIHSQYTDTNENNTHHSLLH